MAFNDDGSKVYIVGTVNDNIYEYSLSTPYDISTGSYIDFLDISSQDSNPNGMAFNDDGSKVYMIGDNGNIYEYDVGVNEIIINNSQTLDSNILYNNTFTFSKTNWFNLTQTESTITEDITITFEDVYDTIVNISVQEFQTNTTISNSTASLSYLTSSGYWYGNSTTTNGTHYIPALASAVRSYSLSLTSTNYADYSQSYNITTAGYYNITASLGRTASVYMSWYDEQSLDILNTTTISWELIQDGSYTNGSTTNGTQIVENLSVGDYTLRYSASGYDERFYYFTVVADSYNDLTLYLLNSTVLTNVTMTVVDENDDGVTSAIVKALRYESSTGNYELRDQCQTGNSGTCVLKLTYNDEFYKYQVQYEDETKLTTSPEYVVSESIVLQITLGENIGEDYFEWYDVDASLVFNNATNNFKLTYNDNNGVATNFCLYVSYYKYGVEYDIGSSCNQLPSGSILVNTGTLQNDTLYIARAYYEDNFLISATHQTSANDSFGNLGLLFQIFLTIVFIGVSVWEISLLPMAVSLSIVLGRFINLNLFPWQNIWILVVLSIILTWFIKRYR